MKQIDKSLCIYQPSKTGSLNSESLEPVSASKYIKQALKNCLNRKYKNPLLLEETTKMPRYLLFL